MVEPLCFCDQCEKVSAITYERERIVKLLEPFGECEPSICGKGCRSYQRREVMPVNPITGVVTYTLDEWKEESQLWEHNGALLERERIIELLEPLGECEPSICGKGCRGEHRCIGWAYRHAIRLIKGDN